MQILGASCRTATERCRLAVEVGFSERLPSRIFFLAGAFGRQIPGGIGGAMSQAISEGYRLLHRDLGEVFYPDLVAFLGLKMRETELYDYKREFRKDGADLAKTMAAFANTSGGTLLIGVSQDKNTGEPSDVVGVDGGENALIERVQQIALSHIFPALPIEAKAIPIPDHRPGAGRRVVIVRIHASPQAPHADVRHQCNLCTDRRD
jgi:hypothetical protein